jgi:hypothetical protein
MIARSEVGLPPAGIRPVGVGAAGDAGPGTLIEFPPDGLAVCARTGAAIVNIATTATPANRPFIL